MSLNGARILIADDHNLVDHNLVAELCKALLEPEFDVIGTVSGGDALLRAAVELKPDLIVLDIAMPVLNGLDAGRQVKEVLRPVKLVYLTMNTDPEMAVEAFHRGASGYLLKTCAASEMVLAVRDVLRGKTYLSPTLKEKVNYLRWERKEIVEEANRLTERQRQVLQLLAEGKVMKEIACILKMTTRTVAFHKYRIMGALGAKSNAELVRYAVRNRLVAA
jgi:DNA-binding NarL/FixJ family response regulator